MIHASPISLLDLITKVICGEEYKLMFINETIIAAGWPT
jgi:hypothetical protein